PGCVLRQPQVSTLGLRVLLAISTFSVRVAVAQLRASTAGTTLLRRTPLVDSAPPILNSTRWTHPIFWRNSSTLRTVPALASSVVGLVCATGGACSQTTSPAQPTAVDSSKKPAPRDSRMAVQASLNA